MKFFISTLLLLFPLVNHAQENNRWFIEKANGKLGFIDSTGTEIFTGSYEMLGEHYNSGLVSFIKNDKYGYLDVNGKVAFRVDTYYGSFSEGLLAVNNNDGFFYYDTSGEIAIALDETALPEGKEVSKIFRFSDGMAMVVIKDSGFDDTGHEGEDILFAEYINPYPNNWYYGFINRKGEWQIPPILSSATTFQEGVSLAVNDSISFFMDTLGQVITIYKEQMGEIWTEIESDIFDYSEGFAKVYNEDGRCYYINLHGQRITDMTFKRANEFFEGMACVQPDDKWGFIDTSGTMVIPPIYNSRDNFSEGLAPVSIRIEEKGYAFDCYYKEGFINKTGETVLPFQPHVTYGGFKNGLTKGRRGIYNNKKYTGYYELFYMNDSWENVWSEVVKQ